jgi:aspartate ammonia-lyase
MMPAKINPSILEMMNMVCFQVIGCDTTISYAVQAGQLELNVMMPVMSCNLNFAARIFGNAVKILDTKCVSGIKCNQKRCAEYAEKSVGLATALNPHIGYLKAAEAAKRPFRTTRLLLTSFAAKRSYQKPK